MVLGNMYAFYVCILRDMSVFYEFHSFIVVRGLVHPLCTWAGKTEQTEFRKTKTGFELTYTEHNELVVYCLS